MIGNLSESAHPQSKVHALLAHTLVGPSSVSSTRRVRKGEVSVSGTRRSKHIHFFVLRSVEPPYTDVVGRAPLPLFRSRPRGGCRWCPRGKLLVLAKTVFIRSSVTMLNPRLRQPFEAQASSSANHQPPLTDEHALCLLAVAAIRSCCPALRRTWYPVGKLAERPRSCTRGERFPAGATQRSTRGRSGEQGEDQDSMRGLCCATSTRPEAAGHPLPAMYRQGGL